MEIIVSIVCADSMDREGAEIVRETLVKVAELLEFSNVEHIVTSKIVEK